MARVAGVEISNDKKLWVSLMGIYGIGEKKAKQLCIDTNIDKNILVKNMTENELDIVRKFFPLLF